MELGRGILYIAGVGLASHYVGEALPRRWFHPDRFPYRDYAWEDKGAVYRKLGIQHWKDHVPDMSKVMPRMVPKKVSLHGSADEAMVLVQETCVAEAVHWALIPFAVGLPLVCPGGWGAALGILYALSNLPFILIQRYNRPKLLRVAQRLRHKEELSHHESTDSHL